MTKHTQAEADKLLQNFLDAVYSTSHSHASVHSYSTAIRGGKNGFRKFLDENYNMDEGKTVFLPIKKICYDLILYCRI